MGKTKKFFDGIGKSSKKTSDKTGLTKVANTAASATTKVADTVASGTTKVADEAVKGATTLADEAGKGITTEAEAAAKFTKSAAGQVWNTALDAVKDVKNIAEDAISGAEDTFGARGGIVSPKVNMKCDVPTGFLSPIGSFFKGLLLTIVGLFVLFYFIMPLIIVIYVTFASCKIITLDIFKDIKNIIVSIIKNHTTVRTLFCVLILWKMIDAMNKNLSIATIVPLLIVFIMEVVCAINDSRNIKERGISTFHPVWSILNGSKQLKNQQQSINEEK